VENRYYLQQTASLALLAAALAAVYIGQPAITGASIILSYFAHIQAEKTSKMHGKGPSAELLNSTTPNLIEFASLGGIYFLTQHLWVLTLAVIVIAVYKTSYKRLEDIKSIGYNKVFGEKERVLGIALIYFFSSLNSYIIFYGLIGLISLTVLEAVRETALIIE
jgi:hypothetical protein